MKQFKKVTIFILFALGLFWILSLATGNVFVIPISKYSEKKSIIIQSDTINPLTNFDLNKGEWKAYLVVSKSEYKQLNRSFARTNVLKTTNLEVLKMMQKEWFFKHTGGDMATAESSFYLIKDGKLVFVSGIILDSHKVGLQNKEYGWLESFDRDSILNTFIEFKGVYWPIIFL